MTHLRRPEHFVKKLFASRWKDLHGDNFRIPDGEYPGVYLLAYSNDKLAGRKVREDQVFYVGMSHAGLSHRVHEFKQGIENGRQHSGAMRFYAKFAKGNPYSKLRNRQRFYVVSVAVPCVYKKGKRKPDDLRALGSVAALEWYVLAHILERTHQEPRLNKK